MRTSSLPAGRNRLVRSLLLGTCLLLGATAGCRDSTGPGARVATVEVSGPTDAQGRVAVEAGATVQLTATARNASGEALKRSFTWSSSNEAVAVVTPDGVVAGVAAGTATIAAEAGGKRGELTVTVLPEAVASVAVSPETAVVPVGGTKQFEAFPRSATGAVLTGRTVSWSSSDTAVAAVSSSGLVTGRGAGSATITARSEGKEGTASVSVFVPTAASVAVAPGFATVDVGGSTGLRATALTAQGDTVRGRAASWSSTESGVARVDAAGSATGVAAGVARIAAQMDQAADTAVVAVLGSQSLLSTAFFGGAVRAAAKPGATVAVPVVLDMSRVSPTGDLGSAQLELTFDSAVLRYDSAQAGVKGSAVVHQSTPGVVRFAFAATAPQGSAKLTLVTLYFRVSAEAPAGAVRELALRYSEAPRSTTFGAYSLPLPVGGRIRVQSP